jgi:hypothetical protein
LNLKSGRRQLQSVKPEVQVTFELDRLSFLMNTSNCIEQPKNQQDVARRKKVKEEEQEVETQVQTVLTLGLDQITKLIYRLDGPLGEGNV